MQRFGQHRDDIVEAKGEAIGERTVAGKAEQLGRGVGQRLGVGDGVLGGVDHDHQPSPTAAL